MLDSASNVQVGISYPHKVENVNSLILYVKLLTHSMEHASLVIMDMPFLKDYASLAQVLLVQVILTVKVLTHQEHVMAAIQDITFQFKELA